MKMLPTSLLRKEAVLVLRRPSALVALLMLTFQQLKGAGVVALKEQTFHDDSSAKPLIYTDMIDDGAPFVKFQASGKSITVERSKIAAKVDVPASIPAQITDDATILPLRRSIKEMTNFSDRFPQMRPIFTKHIETLSTHIKEYESGHFRVGGKWLTKQEFELTKKLAEQKTAKSEDEENARVAQRQAFEAEQRSKGLIKFNGVWMKQEQVDDINFQIASRLQLKEISKMWDELENGTYTQKLDVFKLSGSLEQAMSEKDNLACARKLANLNKGFEFFNYITREKNPNAVGAASFFKERNDTDRLKEIYKAAYRSRFYGNQENLQLVADGKGNPMPFPELDEISNSLQYIFRLPQINLDSLFSNLQRFSAEESEKDASEILSKIWPEIQYFRWLTSDQNSEKIFEKAGMSRDRSKSLMARETNDPEYLKHLE